MRRVRSKKKGAAGASPDASQHFGTFSRTAAPNPLPQDRYCESSNTVVEETDDADKQRIHAANAQCKANPWYPESVCDEQTTVLIEELRRKQERQRTRRRRSSGVGVNARAPAAADGPFVFPGTPDTEASHGLADDPEFYTKITEWLAGRTGKPRCNYVVRNKLHPEEPDCRGYKPPTEQESVAGSDGGGRRSRSRGRRSRRGGDGNRPINIATFYPQQRLAAEFVTPESPYRGLLCYHGLGSGKTLMCIGVITRFLQGEPSRTILVLLKPSLIQNFNDEMAKIDTVTLFGKNISDSERDKRLRRNVNVVTFEAIANRLNGATKWDLEVNKQVSRAQRKGQSDVDGVPLSTIGLGALPDGTVQPDTVGKPMLENTLVIIDEAHNLVTPEDAKYPPVDKAYSVLSAMRRARDCRIILLTATPMRKEPYEIGILVNMLKHVSSPSRFPEAYITKKMQRATVDIVDRKKTKALFDAMFTDRDPNGVLRTKNESHFMQLCKGLVSFYPIDNLFTQFARKVFHTPQEAVMSDELFVEYQKKRQKELKEVGAATAGDGIPLSCADHPKQCSESRQFTMIRAHQRGIVRDKLRRAKNSDIKTYLSQVVAKDAPKIAKLCAQIERRGKLGKQFVYSFWDVQGVFAISHVLTQMGYVQYEGDQLINTFLRPKYRHFSKINQKAFADDFETTKITQLPPSNRRTFTVLGLAESDGKPFSDYKEKIIKLFYNMDANTSGEFINVLIVNRKYSEGISLQAVRTVHIAEPATSLALEAQIIGRAIRNCSHKLLKFPEEWKVDVYNYYTVHPTQARYLMPTERSEKRVRADAESTPAAKAPPPTTGRAARRAVAQLVANASRKIRRLSTRRRSTRRRSTRRRSSRRRGGKNEGLRTVALDQMTRVVLGNARLMRVVAPSSKSDESDTAAKTATKKDVKWMNVCLELCAGVTTGTSSGGRHVLLLLYISCKTGALVAFSCLCDNAASCGADQRAKRVYERRRIEVTSATGGTQQHAIYRVTGAAMGGEPLCKTSATVRMKVSHRLATAVREYAALESYAPPSDVGKGRDANKTTEKGQKRRDASVSARDKVIGWNPCEQEPNAVMCQRNEHCEWSTVQGTQEKRCQSLPIDYTIHKMAIVRGRVSEKFLDLLERAAVDFYAFQELHNDRSRSQFEKQERPELESFMDAAKEGVGDSVLGGESMATVDCRAKNSTQCHASPFCYAGRSGQCEKKRIGTNHGRCREYHGRNQASCASDPMCVWRADDQSMYGLDSRVMCHNRYLAELNRFSFAIGLHHPAGGKHHFRMYEMTPTAVVEQDAQRRVKSFLQRFKKPHATVTTVLHSLVELQELAESCGAVLVAHDKELREVIQAHREANPKPWKNARVARRTAGINQLYAYDVETTDAEAPDDAERTRAPTHVEVLFDREKGALHNLHELKQQQLDYLHYCFHLQLGDDHFYFHSNEKKDAPLELANLGRISSVRKNIQFMNLSAYITFMLDERACIRGVRISALKKGKRTAVSEMTLPVTTTVYDRSGRRVQLLDEVDCARLWQMNRLGYPLPQNVDGDAIGQEDAAALGPELAINVNACNWKWQRGPTFSTPRGWNTPDAEAESDGDSGASDAGKRRAVKDTLASGEECTDGEDCLNAAAERSPRARFGRNPFTCKSGIKFWQKNCNLQPQDAPLYTSKTYRHTKTPRRARTHTATISAADNADAAKKTTSSTTAQSRPRRRTATRRSLAKKKK